MAPILPEAIARWHQQIAQHLAHLSPGQARVLAQYSFGTVLARHSGLETVAAVLAPLFDQPHNTVRQRLREFYLPAGAKAGATTGLKRRDFHVSDHFADLLRWVMGLCPLQPRQLFLALDVTSLRGRFDVLCVSVLVCATAIPVAWKVLPATHKTSWRPIWQQLLGHLAAAVGPEWSVVVSADRGLYAPWLFGAITALGWHPLLRVNWSSGGLFKPEGKQDWQPLSQILTGVGQSYSGRGVHGKTHSLPCTLLAEWSPGYAEPWVLVTDLAPGQVQAHWYRVRTWIEGGFRDFKSDGWGWQYSRMEDPERAERLWLVLSVASVLALSVSQTESSRPSAAASPRPPARPGGSRRRVMSCLVSGIVALVCALASGRAWEFVKVLPPSAWPQGGLVAGEPVRKVLDTGPHHRQDVHNLQP